MFPCSANAAAAVAARVYNVMLGFRSNANVLERLCKNVASASTSPLCDAPATIINSRRRRRRLRCRCRYVVSVTSSASTALQPPHHEQHSQARHVLREIKCAQPPLAHSARKQHSITRPSPPTTNNHNHHTPTASASASSWTSARTLGEHLRRRMTERRASSERFVSAIFVCNVYV